MALSAPHASTLRKRVRPGRSAGTNAGDRGRRWLSAGGFVLATAACAFPSAAAAQAELIARLDSAARAHVANPLVPGVSVAVVKDGETLLQRGYGYVDLEWEVATPRDARASYEIGSITKQFTAAAAMLLVEEGRLDLEADFTDYVPFETGGRYVPVRRLLDHTSGIKGYTEMTVFGELTVQDLPVDSLIRLIEAEPFEFEPGRAMTYNNSAYFLMGLVIEEVSGQSYADFVRERLFEPLGMDDSYYCSESAIRPRRAHGYDLAGADSLVRAGYLNHKWPYAAGSLCSTVEDLVTWNRALHGGAVLGSAAYRTLVTPAPLDDGTPLRYAMGLGVRDVGGRLLIQHGGGINGFLSDGRYYPDDDLIVVVLQNGAVPPSPASLGQALERIVLGPPAPQPTATFSGSVDPFLGSYAGPARGQRLRVEVVEEEGRLHVRIGGAGESQPLAYRGGLMWSLGATELTFVRIQGRITELRFDSGGGHYVLVREG